MLGGKGKGVDAAKVAVRPVLDDFFDRTHRFRLSRLSQATQERVGFSGTFHGTFGLITLAAALWLSPFACYLLDLNSTDRFDAKPDRRSNGKHDKKRQNNELRGPKWLLGLCWSKRADILVVSAVVAVCFNLFVAVMQSFEMQFRSLLRSDLR